MSNGDFDPHKHPGPLEDLEKQSTQNNNPRIAIIIAVLVLFLGGGIAMFVYMSESGSSNPEEAFAFIPFLPIWIAIFIPFFIKKKKQGTTGKNRDRIIVFVAVGIAVLIALTAGLLLFVANEV